MPQYFYLKQNNQNQYVAATRMMISYIDNKIIYANFELLISLSATTNLASLS